MNNKPIAYQILFIAIIALLLLNCQDEKLNAINEDPVIDSASISSDSVSVGATVLLSAEASDNDNDSISYRWLDSSGQVLGNSSNILWTTPETPGTYSIIVEVEDQNGGLDSNILSITVNAISVDSNNVPFVSSLIADSDTIKANDTTSITLSVSDADGDPLSISWTNTGGTIIGSDTLVNWISPNQPGTYTVYVSISDGNGGSIVSDISFQIISANGNSNPTIASFSANKTAVPMGGKITLTVSAQDPDSDTLSYSWAAMGGVEGSGQEVIWEAPVGPT